MTEIIYSAFQTAARSHGERAAICYVDPADLDLDDAEPRRIRYRQLLRDVTGLANAFRELSGTDNPVVSLMLPSTIAGLTALLANAQSRSCQQPLTSLGSQSPPHYRAHRYMSQRSPVQMHQQCFLLRGF